MGLPCYRPQLRQDGGVEEKGRVPCSLVATISSFLSLHGQIMVCEILLYVIISYISAIVEALFLFFYIKPGPDFNYIEAKGYPGLSLVLDLKSLRAREPPHTFMCLQSALAYFIWDASGFNN